MREIVLDTETTGLDPSQGHRVIEIGAVELINHLPTGRIFHVHINPERDVPKEAAAIHGLTTEFLKGKPVFHDILDDFKAFIQEDILVIHNAAFDLSFLNAELTWQNHAVIASDRVIDTLQLARRKHPMGPNSLDALCKRYGVDNSRREKHGALLDSELLAAVYIELIGGRQPGLSLETKAPKQNAVSIVHHTKNLVRKSVLLQRLTDEERDAHSTALKKLQKPAIWNLKD